MLPSTTDPLWMDARIPEFEPLRREAKFDAVVIGGGATGLSAALFLKQAGKRVCLLERKRLGQAETGHTTAHLTCVTDIRLRELVKHFGKDTAALVWYAGTTALGLIEQTVDEYEIDCNFRRVPGFLHAALDGDKDETEELKDEASLARELGFDAEFVANVPVVGRPGIRLPDQAKFHPAWYLAGLAKAIHGDGSEIHEQSEVSEVEAEPLAVVANDIKVACDFVVIATHVPLMGKSGLFSASLLQTKLASYSTYVVSGLVPAGGFPDLSAWDTGDPYYYLRIDSGRDGDRVIFGGNDHKTGQEMDTESCYTRLQDRLMSLIPEVNVDHRWSGQVIQTNDGLPYIGISSERQFVATGFNGNGITFGTLSGMMARDAMLERENPWCDLFSVGRTHVRGGTWEYIKENVDFPFYLIADRLKTRKKKGQTTRSIKRGQGSVLKLNGQRVACSRDENGTLQKVSAVCTHLGCLVRWNAAEQTWDCPCHGSRFLPNGDVIAGPAESPLEQIGRGGNEPKPKAKSDHAS